MTPKRLALLAAALLCLASFGVDAQITAPAPETRPDKPEIVPLPEALRAAGEAVIQALRSDDLKAIEARFDTRMRDTLTHEKFVTSSAGIKQQFGSLQDCAAPVVSAAKAYTVAEYRCAFSLAPAKIRIAMNAKGEVGGLLFEPLPPEAKVLPLPDNVREEETVVGAEGWPLPGTLMLPASAKRHPFVVFVHGSGPNDRDESIGPNKPFRDLAYGLGAQGIASLRYDKRTKALTARFKNELRNWTLDDEVVDDAVAALAKVAARDDAGPLFVVGHSLGALLAPRIVTAAAKKGIRVEGIVMLAAPATPLADVIVYQYEFLALLTVPTVTAQTLAEIRTQRENVRRLIDQGKDDPPVGPLLLGMPASAWLDAGRYDPAASLLDQPALPALLIFGGRDFQVPIREKRLWDERIGSRPNTRFVEFASVGHLMIDGRGSMSPAEYDKPGLVSQDVIDRVGSWITALAKMPRP